MNCELPLPPLTVYKASAGSGKTFTLAVEYIKLLLANPRAYENILAVTFTNKATEEMKMRILQQLYGLSHRLPASKGYLRAIQEDTGLDENFVATQAGKALSLLLHNYHYFRVETIDKFFQSVLRNLAKELQLNANLRIALNNNQVVDQAVDSIIDSLADDHALLNTVLGYMERQLDDNHKWNIIGTLKIFGRNIFSEFYKKNRSRIDSVFADKDFFTNYRNKLNSIMTSLTEKYVRIGSDVISKLEEEGMSVDDFSHKKAGPAGYFYKMSQGVFYSEPSSASKFINSYVQAAIDNSSKWLTKERMKDPQYINAVEEYLSPLLNHTEQHREADAKLHRSCKVTLHHLADLQMLQRIEQSANNLNETAQRFMLSDTQTLLHEVIDQSDSPFIFEKIGARLENIMIDEFQDTSVVQWENFQTLLRECIGKGGHNIIVGDVKQSIYRFRQGDWRLLNDIEEKFRPSEISLQPKKTNWRSCRNIISFNNAFFRLAAEAEVRNLIPFTSEGANKLSKAYADVVQEIPDGLGHEGLVRIEMLPPKLNADEEDPQPERTLQIIEDLLNTPGIRQRDICILVRKNKVIPVLANYIEEHDSRLHIVSAEAFRLDASRAVNTVVGAMRLLSHPTDALVSAALQKTIGSELPPELLDQRDSLLAMTLHDLAEELVRMFRLDETTDEAAYLSAFFDQLQSFSNDMAPVLEEFLQAWDDDIAEKTIETADCDGIRIMTIHKSKGLEFRHVILPYCDWKLEPASQTLWVMPSEEPFKWLPMVPIEYRGVKSLSNTIYQSDGIEEYMQNMVDNLNTLYVAMTRAGQSLFIIGRMPKSNGEIRSRMICDVVRSLPPSIDDVPVVIEGTDAATDSAEPLIMTYGSLPAQYTPTLVSNRPEITENVFDVTPEPLTVGMTSIRSEVTYRQSNDSRRFADDEYDNDDRQRYIRLGTLMHQLFSIIHTTDDIKPAIRQMEADGLLDNEQLSPDILEEKLRRCMDNPQVAEWFDAHWTVFNECAILTPEGEKRPDRVITDGERTIVIDFKFGAKHNEHIRQVGEYATLLQGMGMPQVSSYLWYVNRGEVVRL